MSAKTNPPLLESPAQHSCLQHSCCPDVQHTNSREQGGRASAHHHQQHRERQRWAWAQLSCGDSWGAPGSRCSVGEPSSAVLLPLEEVQVLVSSSFQSVLHHHLPKPGCGGQNDLP